MRASSTPKRLAVMVLAGLTLALPAASQQGEDSFLDEQTKAAELVELKAEAHAVADRAFLQAVQAGVEYFRRYPEESRTLVSSGLVEQITAAAQSPEALDALWDKLDSAREARKDVPASDNPILIVAEIGATYLDSRSAETRLKRLRADLADMPEGFRARLHSVLDTRADSRDLLKEVASLFEKDAEAGESQSVPSTPARTTTSPGVGSAGCDSTGNPSSLTDGTAACVLPGRAVPPGGRAFSTRGLIAQRSFPLDRYLPCIRDQASRGTCAAFAMVANMELRWHKDKGRKLNLSEQHLYLRAEVDTGRQRYRYGMVTQDVVKFMAQKGHGTGYESEWRYNPSYSISSQVNKRGTASWTDDVYDGSCANYSGICTGAAFQGSQNRTQTIFYAPPVSTVMRLHNYTQYSWGVFTSRAEALREARAVLGSKPVLLAAALTRNFVAGAPDGYLVWSSSDRPADGGHAMLIVGYVGKSSLPANAPKPAGDGYYIVRNSWGAGRSDCGYEYLDAKWVERQMTSLTSFSVR